MMNKADRDELKLSAAEMIQGGSGTMTIECGRLIGLLNQIDQIEKQVLPAVEATSEMIEAGLAVMKESGRLIGDQLMSGDGILVQEIYRAMVVPPGRL